MYSCGPPHMDVQEWDDQHELTYSSYVRTRDVTLKTCRRRWMIGRNGERRSGISAQAARHDDDDDCTKSTNYNCIIVTCMSHSFFNSLAKVKVLIFLFPFFQFCFIIIYSFRVFHITVSWWFFTGVRMNASLLKSPGLVSGFWPFSAMLSFGYSLPVSQLPSPPGPLIIL